MIHQTEVDGVLTLLAPGAGPMRAGLVFRVGTADETLPLSGITHLVEHLALHRLGVADYHYNGVTSATETHFHVQGSPEHVSSYLNGVCHGLTELPLERLETERTILRTEATGRAPDPGARWRHGARDYGLSGYPEWGVGQVHPDQVRAWAASWFTRANAVLWIVGDAVPPGLRLALPDGDRRPLPVPSVGLTGTPACVPLAADGVRFDGEVDRGTAARMFSGVLERHLFRELRQEGGYSYTIGTRYERLGPGKALVVAVADGQADAFDAVIGGLVDTLAALRHGQVEDADLKALVVRAEEQARRPDADGERLPQIAVDVLTGHPVHLGEQVVEQARAVDAAALAAVARQAWSTGLLLVPGRDARWTGAAHATRPSEREPYPSPPTAASFKARDHGDLRLVLGAEETALASPDGASVVRHDAVAALLAWPDGARQLVGVDGTSLAIEPSRFGIDAPAVAAFTARIQPSQVVWMPARDPAEIPTAASWQRQATSGGSGSSGGRGGVLGLVLMILLAAAPTIFLLLATLGAILDPEVDAFFWIVLVVLWTIPLGLWWAVYRMIRRRRRPRHR